MPDEFLLFSLYVMELVAAVTGFLYWKKIKDSHWKWFPVFLATIFLLEITCYHLKSKWSNPIVIYVNIPLEFLFYFWLFYAYFRQSRLRYGAIAAGIIYVSTLLAEALLLAKKKFMFQSLSYEVGNLLLVVLIITFFIRFAKSDKILHYWRDQMFWVCIGLIVFFLGTLPFFSFWNSLLKYDRAMFNGYRQVMFVLACLMYGCFSVSFIWSKKLK
jgi:hypothetical protein